MKKVFALLIALLVFSAPAYANLVVNGDFEDGTNGWTQFQSGWGGGFSWSAYDAGMGDGTADGVLQCDSGSFGWYQEIPVIVGQQYTIDCVWMGNGSSAWSEVLFFSDDGRPRIEQLDSGDPVGHGFVVAKYDSWGLGSYPFGPIQLSAMPPSQLLIGTLTITATSPTLIVGLKCGSGGGGVVTAFDNVTVTGPAVPEPASILAMVIGVGGLVLRRRQ